MVSVKHIQYATDLEEAIAPGSAIVISLNQDTLNLRMHTEHMCKEKEKSGGENGGGERAREKK